MHNALFLVTEVMSEKFLNYLPVTVINNLLFVSMYTRQVIFKKFKDIYYLSTGFTSEKHWYSIVQKTAQDLCEVVLNEKFFDPVFFSTISIMKIEFVPYWKNSKHIYHCFQCACTF